MFQHFHAFQRAGRNRDREGASFTSSASNADRSSEQLSKPLADCQSQTGPRNPTGRRGIDLRERLEQAFHVFLRHSDTRIDDIETYLQFARFTTDHLCHQTDAADFGELDGVPNKIDEDLPQAHWAGEHRFGNGALVFDNQLNSLRRGADSHQGRHIRHNLPG